MIDQPRESRSAQIRHRGWLSEIGVLQLHLKKTNKKEGRDRKRGIEKEKINTKVGQPIWMLKRSIICFINLFNLISKLFSNF
jgi:hypothetical protein